MHVFEYLKDIVPGDCKVTASEHTFLTLRLGIGIMYTGGCLKYCQYHGKKLYIIPMEQIEDGWFRDDVSLYFMQREREP